MNRILSAFIWCFIFQFCSAIVIGFLTGLFGFYFIEIFENDREIEILGSHLPVISVIWIVGPMIGGIIGFILGILGRLPRIGFVLGDEKSDLVRKPSDVQDR